MSEGFPKKDIETAVDLAFGSLKLAYTYLEDKTDLISDKVLAFLEKPQMTDTELIKLIDGLGYKTGLDKVMNSFGLVFRWILRSRSGEKPTWTRLNSIVSSLSARMSRKSLINNIYLTEKMSAQVFLNPTPSLFLYRYLSSLEFN